MIVLGIDGMDPQFLEAHWSSLPNLNRLRQEGDFKPLATTIPPQSPVAWSSVTTGMDPGGHGIFDFVHRNPFTRMPMSSMAEVTAPARTITIGPYVLPLSSGGVKSMRAGRAFWQVMGDHGVHATVIRMPANFPAVDCEQESLSGMGTPDLRGTAHTYAFYTDDPAEKRKDVSGGEICQGEAGSRPRPAAGCGSAQHAAQGQRHQLRHPDGGRGSCGECRALRTGRAALRAPPGGMVAVVPRLLPFDPRAQERGRYLPRLPAAGAPVSPPLP